MKFAGLSSKGKKRRNNEDRFLIKQISPEDVLLAVADGLGGQPAGHIAAQTAVRNIEGLLSDTKNPEKDLSNLLIKIDDVVARLSETDPELEYMGTTLTIAFTEKKMLYWAHIGDTRIYHLRNNELIQITIDQTMAQFLFEEGEITEEEALNHPMQNLLDQSIGSGACEPETGSFPISSGDIVLICSDGLYSEISSEHIKEVLISNRSIHGKINYLIKAANDAGGRDNITAVAMKY